MSDVQILTVILSTTSTLLVVLVGMFLHTRQIDSVRNELRTEITGTHARIDSLRNELRAEIRAVYQKLDMFIRLSDERFKILLQKIEEIGSRMARMEGH